MTTPDVRLCLPTARLDAELLRLYEGSFPAAERESVERLSELLAKGRMLCHRTLNEQGELLCFTIVTLGDNFSFLAYMATNPARRSNGVGSRHLKRLLELLREAHPDHIGMFLEIEATDPEFETLSEEERAIRIRRRAFYERAGARMICPEGIYLTVKYDDRSKEWEGELMGFEFHGPIAAEQLTHLLEQIYMLCYQLSKDHPLVRKVLAYFGPCLGGSDGNCQGEVAEPLDSTKGGAKEDEMAKDDDCGCQGRARRMREWWQWLKERFARLFGR